MLTDSMSSSVLSCNVSYSTSFIALVLLLLHTFQKWPILLHSMHIFPYAGHCLSGWVLPQYLHICFDGVLGCVDLLWLSLWEYLDILILSNSFITADWALCTSSIIFAHDKIFSLVIVTFLFVVVSSLIISPSIFLSFSPWINCSFKCLSSSW